MIIIASLGGTSLGSVTKESHTIDAGLEIEPFPYSGASETEVFDENGVTHKFTVNGTYVAASQAAANSWVVSIEAKVNGAQDSASYVSDIAGRANTNVKIENFRWDMDVTATGTCAVSYTLSLVETAVGV